MKSSIPQQIYTDIKYIIDNQLIVGDCFKPITNNSRFEQLEFFGDSYLNFRIAKIAIQKTTFDPCLLTEFRSFATSNTTLTELYEMVGMEALPGIERDENKKKLKADVVEALVGELHSEKSNPKVKKLLNDIISQLTILGEIKFNFKHQKILFAHSNTFIVNHVTDQKKQQQQNSTSLPNNSSITTIKHPQAQPNPFSNWVTTPTQPIVNKQQKTNSNETYKNTPQQKLSTSPTPSTTEQFKKNKNIVEVVPSTKVIQHISKNTVNNNQPTKSIENYILEKPYQDEQILYNIDLYPTKPQIQQKEILLSPFSINTFEGNFY